MEASPERPLSPDDRRKAVVTLRLAGASTYTIAEQLGVSARTVTRDLALAVSLDEVDPLTLPEFIDTKDGKRVYPAKRQTPPADDSTPFGQAYFAEASDQAKVAAQGLPDAPVERTSALQAQVGERQYTVLMQQRDQRLAQALHAQYEAERLLWLAQQPTPPTPRVSGHETMGRFFSYLFPKDAVRRWPLGGNAPIYRVNPCLGVVGYVLAAVPCLTPGDDKNPDVAELRTGEFLECAGFSLERCEPRPDETGEDPGILLVDLLAPLREVGLPLTGDGVLPGCDVDGLLAPHGLRVSLNHLILGSRPPQIANVSPGVFRFYHTVAVVAVNYASAFPTFEEWSSC